MKLAHANAEILTAPDGHELLKQIEAAGRTCYKSEDKITDESCEKFVRNIIKRGHEAVLEHGAITVRFTCDRGVSHEIVRHRIASFCQESTRYCNYGQDKYGNEVSFIRPSFWEEDSPEFLKWKKAMEFAENTYLAMLDMGATPQEARSVLPNSLKTEVVMTANPREWRHFFKLRTSSAAHPDMRAVTIPLLIQFKSKFPVLFEDIEVQL